MRVCVCVCVCGLVTSSLAGDLELRVYFVLPPSPPSLLTLSTMLPKLVVVVVVVVVEEEEEEVEEEEGEVMKTMKMRKEVISVVMREEEGEGKEVKKERKEGLLWRQETQSSLPSTLHQCQHPLLKRTCGCPSQYLHCTSCIT